MMLTGGKWGEASCAHCNWSLGAAITCPHCGFINAHVDSDGEALAEPVKQEPVVLSFPRDTTSWTGGWTIDHKLLRSVDDAIDDNEFKPCRESVEQVLLALEKVYAAPVSAKREWVDLTDREAEAAFDRGGNELCLKLRAVIAAYREKNSC